MDRPPRTANINVERYKFQTGDRVLVRVYERLDKDTYQRIYNTVRKWAGKDVEILVIDETRMTVDVERRVVAGG